MARLHGILSPRLYMQIGVGDGASLVLARCPAIAIDAKPRVEAGLLPATARVHAMTSDRFFATDTLVATIDRARLDLALIDGRHRFESALRDFMNLERVSHPGTLIVVDDVKPRDAAEASRTRQAGAWTGDVYKLSLCLRAYRPDLRQELISASPTGMLAISNLDPSSTVLRDRHASIVSEYVEAWRAPLPDAAYFDAFIAPETWLARLRARQRAASPRPAAPASLPLDRRDRSAGHIVIVGTGRAGTTFLVQLFTRLGFDTGFTIEQAQTQVSPISHAGLEHAPSAFRRWPLVVKSPHLSLKLGEMVRAGKVKVLAVVLPVRDIAAAAESRRRVTAAGETRGGIWLTRDADAQEDMLLRANHLLLCGIAEEELRHVLLGFPRHVRDGLHAWRQLKPVLTPFGVTEAEFLEAHAATVRRDLLEAGAARGARAAEPALQA